MLCPRLATHLVGGKLVVALVALALAASTGALLLDAALLGGSVEAHAAISPAPLFLIGIAILAVQVWLRPSPGAPHTRRGRRVLRVVGFGPGTAAECLPATLGDVVIAPFVVDLAIVIRQETRGDRDEAL